jgi:hypothetical protein
MNKVIQSAAISLAGVGIAIGAVACGPGHSTSLKVSASQSAAAKANAKDLTKCIPSGSLQQIELAKSLSTHSGRETLINMCGIPAKNKTAFEAAVLSAAETGHLTTSSGRSTFFNVTLPQIIEKYQG